MRALVLLVTCVILLATLQASYLIVDAKHNKEVITDDAHQEVDAPVVPHDVPHKSQKHQHHHKNLAVTDDEHKDKGLMEKPDQKTYYQTDKKYAGYGKQLRWRRCRDNSELCKKGRKNRRAKEGKKGRDHRDKKERRKGRRNNKGRYESSKDVAQMNTTENDVKQILELTLDEAVPSTPGTHYVREQEEEDRPSYQDRPIFPPYEEPKPIDMEYGGKAIESPEFNMTKDANNVAEDDEYGYEHNSMPSLYDQMVGDEPSKDGGKKERNSHRGEQRKAKKNAAKAEKMAARAEKKAARVEKKNAARAEKKAERQQRKAEKQARRQHTNCTTNADCAADECCIRKKRGKMVCMKGGLKKIGKRCDGTCVCREGLQCFVSKMNKRGKERKQRAGKNLMGKCVDPSKTDSASGYFMTTPSPVEKHP